jgi:hypothetical protein
MTFRPLLALVFVAASTQQEDPAARNFPLVGTGLVIHAAARAQERVERPSPIGSKAAELVCNGVASTTIPNDPVAAGCFAKLVDVAPFFAARPYSCATLKRGLFYLGKYPWSDGGAITGRRCIDVRTPADFHDIQNFGPREQMVAIVHNDLVLAPADFIWLASKGELLALGIPQETGRPPKLTAAFTKFNWQTSSGNLALVNLENPGGIDFGSADLPHRQTLTLAGITQSEGPGRLILTRYEGGSAPNNPLTPIDDEVYFKNVLVKAGPNSHNVYLDRNGIQYIEGLVSYGNRGDGNHPLKLTGRLVFLYGSYLSSAGVHGVLPDDNSGQAPLSAVACQRSVIRGNKFLNAVGRSGGLGAAQAQIREAIVACDDPQGWLSNTYPATVYTGPVDYLGQRLSATPYWDPAWWARIKARGTSPPALYANPDMLVGYYLDNTYEVLATAPGVATNHYGIVAQPTFPATHPSPFTAVAPPAGWLERSRLVVANGCFVSGNPGKVSRRWSGAMTCAAPDRPAWLSTYGACAKGASHPDDTGQFVMVGANACGRVDPLPAEVVEAVRTLEAIPDPPWRHW